MTSTPTAEKWAELRKPFPKEAIGLLPKPYKKDSPKGNCTECGKYHGLPAVHLDYIGHAAVTDRLNTVAGPENWDLVPMATDEHGNPMRNGKGELWCWLTIFGARKMCVGDGSDSSKELIGDALRNGAMRFGIALDLWSKEELESQIDHPELKNEKPTATKPSKAVAAPVTAPEPKAELVSKEQVAQLIDLAKSKGYTEKPEIIAFLNSLALGDIAHLPATEFSNVRKAVLEHKKGGL